MAEDKIKERKEILSKEGVRLLVFHSMEELVEYLKNNDPGGMIEIVIKREGLDG